MEFLSLASKNIYPVPAGDFFGVEWDRLYLLYAPLNGRITLISRDTAERLEAGTIDDETKILLNAFQAEGHIPIYNLLDSPSKLFQIDILTNYICNFNCVYCYSAAGRSSKEIEFNSIKVLMDDLFLSGKKQKAPYMINFSGGGEPLISFDMIKKTIEYVESIAGDYRYSFGLVTNGSLITSEIIDFLKSHNVDMAVSFEVLKYLQEKERGAYEKVAANIDLMLKKQYLFGIRTTFTQESVGCMTEIIDELHKRFPGVGKIVFDTVLAPSLFPDPQSLDKYYKDFIREYYKAKKHAAELGILVESIAVETLSIVRERTCNGKIVLTPTGTISTCSRVSSPIEEQYGNYVIGDTRNGRLELDDERYRQIMSEYNIHTQDICHNCFARWNCGGGCRLFHQSFSEEYVKPKCDFQKEGLRIELFNYMVDRFSQSEMGSLTDYISKKIELGEI